jgi:hypothetical protein
MASEKKLLLALQYWSGDYEQAMRLARRIAALEVGPRRDVEFLFVVRFDAPEPSKEAIAELSAKMPVMSYRTRRRGVGHPSGCNDMWHDLLGEQWRRFLQVKGYADLYHGVFSFEADNVPLCADWLDRVLSEWRFGLEQGKIVWGCRVPDVEGPGAHINGNMIFVPDLFGRVRGLEGCPSQHAWDVFHADKWIDKAHYSGEIVNFYRALEVPKKRLYEKTRARYALVHGVKDDSAWNLALKSA